MASAKILIPLVLAIIASSYADESKPFNKEDMDAGKASALFNCIGIIVCKEMRGDELRRLYDKAGPEARHNGMKWMQEIYDWPSELINNLTEFYRGYSDRVCLYSQDQRRNAFKTFMMHFGEWYEEACHRPDMTECEKGNEALAAGEKLVQEYTEKGKCNRPDEAGKAMAETGEDKLKSSQDKMPGYGG